LPFPIALGIEAPPASQWPVQITASLLWYDGRLGVTVESLFLQQTLGATDGDLHAALSFDTMSSTAAGGTFAATALAATARLVAWLLG
jgi:hypothetical protein